MKFVVGSRGLAAALILAVMIALLWAWWVVAHRGSQVAVVPPQSSAQTSNGASYELLDIVATDVVTSQWGNTLTPDPGAEFVTARVRFDARTVTDAGLCTLFLRAGDAQWYSDTFSPRAPEVSSCAAGESGVVVALYQVPRSMVGQIDGVVLVDVNHRWPLLRGQAR
jgi:hypothetical protein